MRIDIFGPVHKALRTGLFNVCVELGRCDFENPQELRIALDAQRRTLGYLREHHGLEESFVEPLVRAAAPDVAALNDAQHRAAAVAIDELEWLAAAIESAPADERGDAGRRLVERHDAFLVDYLAHLRHEETAVNEALWARFSDDELAAMRGRLQASIDPARFLEWLEILLPAMNLDERCAMLGGMKRAAPAAAFAAATRVAAAILGSAGWEAVRARAGFDPSRL
jgi:hypothetical protein